MIAYATAVAHELPQEAGAIIGAVVTTIRSTIALCLWTITHAISATLIRLPRLSCLARTALLATITSTTLVFVIAVFRAVAGAVGAVAVELVLDPLRGASPVKPHPEVAEPPRIRVREEVPDVRFRALGTCPCI